MSHARIMGTDDMGRAIRRMAHEVIERNHGVDDLVVVGLQTGGVPVAERLAETLADIEGVHPLVGTLDVALHRDDKKYLWALTAPVIAVDARGAAAATATGRADLFGARRHAKETLRAFFQEQWPSGEAW